MCSVIKQRWFLLILMLLSSMRLVKLQETLPEPVPLSAVSYQLVPNLIPPIPISGIASFPMFAPFPMALPVMPDYFSNSRNPAVAVPIPLRKPVQFAVPAYPPPSFCKTRPRPYNCPVCPPCLCAPSCTPSFFSYCSPCHQKCRCRIGDKVPEAIPPIPPVPVSGPAYGLPIPVPPPIIKLPVVEIRTPLEKIEEDCSYADWYSSRETSSSESEEIEMIELRNKRKRKKHRKPM